MTARDRTRHQVVRAGQGDVGVLSLVVAEAFFSLAVSRWLIPDRSAAALWIPGDGPGAPPDGYTETLAALTGQHLGNFLAFDEQLDRHHPAGTYHHHLAILAVRPDRQGQGIGTALLHAHHAVLEDQGIPAYLEASDERTRRLARSATTVPSLP